MTIVGVVALRQVLRNGGVVLIAVSQPQIRELICGYNRRIISPLGS